MGEAVKMSATAPVTSRDSCTSVSCLSGSFCLYFSTSSPDNTGFSAMWIPGNPQDWERETPAQLGQPGPSALPTRDLLCSQEAAKQLPLLFQIISPASQLQWVLADPLGSVFLPTISPLSFKLSAADAHCYPTQ